MPRSDRQYSSTCVVGEVKKAKKTEVEGKINDESKNASTHTYHRYLVPDTSPNTCTGALFVLEKEQGSAPRAPDATRYARARKNAAETWKGGRKEKPVFIWCEQRIGTAKMFLCRANCLALCRVFVDVTF